MIFDKNTDADATNRGFLYQYLLTLKSWINKYRDSDDNYELYCEVEDDIKLIDEPNSDILFEQVKCYSTNFSLNTSEIRKSLFNFIILYTKYIPKFKVKFCFTANSGIAKTDHILQEWFKYKRNIKEDINKELLSEIKDKILEIVVSESNKRINSEINAEKNRGKKDVNKSERKIKEIKDARDYIIDIFNVDGDLLEFVNAVDFKFYNKNPMEIIDKEKSIILELIKNTDEMDKAPMIVFSRLLSEIYFRSSEKEIYNRMLTNKLMNSIINETLEEMIENTDLKFHEIISILLENSQKLDSTIEEIEVIGKKLDDISQKISCQGNNVGIKKSISLNFYEEEELEAVEEETREFQSKLESKIKRIQIDKEDEALWISLATELRCRYLLQIEELKQSNLIGERGKLKKLESKVKALCLREVSLIKLKEEFDSEQFWKDFESKLELEAENYSVVNEFRVDTEVVHAQMYQMAAECFLKWHK